MLAAVQSHLSDRAVGRALYYCVWCVYLHAAQEVPADNPAIPLWRLPNNHGPIGLEVGDDELPPFVFRNARPARFAGAEAYNDERIKLWVLIGVSVDDVRFQILFFA